MLCKLCYFSSTVNMFSLIDTCIFLCTVNLCTSVFIEICVDCMIFTVYVLQNKHISYFKTGSFTRGCEQKFVPRCSYIQIWYV